MGNDGLRTDVSSFMRAHTHTTTTTTLRTTALPHIAARIDAGTAGLALPGARPPDADGLRAAQMRERDKREAVLTKRWSSARAEALEEALLVRAP